MLCSRESGKHSKAIAPKTDAVTQGALFRFQGQDLCPLCITRGAWNAARMLARYFISSSSSPWVLAVAD